MKKILAFMTALLFALAACAGQTPDARIAKACTITTALAPTAIGLADSVDYTRQHQVQADAVAAGAVALHGVLCPSEVADVSSAR